MSPGRKERDFNRSANRRSMDEVFEMIASGTPNAQITAYQDNRRQEFEDERARGVASEEKVRDVLKTLPYVFDGKILSGNKKSDRRRRDVVITLKPDEFFERFRDIWVNTNLQVFVQVKSSNSGVEQFLREVKGKHRYDEVELWKYMRSNRLIVLNAQLPDVKVFEQFETQLQNINEFWKTKDTPRASLF